jgi:branched-chain amino acid transport system substrate-binding protein
MDTNGLAPSGEVPTNLRQPEPGADVRTFLIADVRGYTRFTQAYGDEEAGKLAARFAALAREAVTATGGEVIELRGDEALCVFRSARQALRAAVELQTRFRERLDGQPAFPLGIGVGLDSGEAVPIEGGYRGGALNLAARLCSIAAPGQILASETVTSLARTLEGVRFVDRRPVRLKGLDKPVRVIEVVPEAELPPVPEAPSRSTRGRRWAVLVMGAGALILAAAVAAAVFQLVRNGSGEAIEGPGVGVLDPKTGELLATIPFGTAPSSIAVGEGSVWVLDADDRTVSQIDPKERAVVRTFSTGSTPTDLAVGAGGIWMGNGVRHERTALPESVSRFDPESAVVDETIPLHRASDVALTLVGHASLRPHLAVTDTAVWVVNPDLRVSRIDPRTNRVVADVAGVRALSIAAGEGEVWIVNDEDEVVEIDPRTDAASKPIPVAAESLTALAVGAGAVWVADPVGGNVLRIDPDPDQPILHTISVEVGVGGVAFGEGAVWATNELTDEVYRIDPDTNDAQVVSRIAAPRAIALGEGGVWVTSAGPPSAEEALPASSCDKLVYGGAGSPRFVVASDLPLQGPSRAGTLPMTEAIRFVLEQRHFRAGQYTVGYQSCDDSTAQAGGYDLFTCFLNAKAYARDLAVLGVVGPLNSPCAGEQIPIANQARGGALAMISPATTARRLTRPDPGERENQFYPSGKRNFVRIAAADHLQAVAGAQLVKELGARRLFVLAEADGDFGADVETAARNLGLEIVGSAEWNSEARNFDRIARRIALTRPDAVFIGGLFYPNGGALVRNLRARLGADAALIASDYFGPVPDLIEAAGPARGMYLSSGSGVPNGELPPAGKRFLEEFEAREGEPSPSSYPAYAAQAAEILLEAIARSDGTRESVTRELLQTTIEDGILGDIKFDEYGDPVEAPVTIFRVVGKRDHSLDGYFKGAVIDRVITARAALLR